MSLYAQFPILIFLGTTNMRREVIQAFMYWGGGICKTGSHLLLDVENIDIKLHQTCY